MIRLASFLFFLCLTQSITFSQSDNTLMDVGRLTTAEVREADPESLATVDLSAAFLSTPNHQIFGFIGEEFQRFRIKFISVVKNQGAVNQYLVYGKTMVRNHVVPFQGIVQLNTWNIHEGAETQQSGIIGGTYTFYEQAGIEHSGILQGSFSSHIYQASANEWLCDDRNSEADEYANNQFSGTWKAYEGGLVLPCRWGDYRIPDCADLDAGLADFYPAIQYQENGWQNYVKLADALYGKNKEALKKEMQTWWEHP